MKNSKYLLISPDMKTIVDDLVVSHKAYCMRWVAELHWEEQIKDGCTVWSSLDTNKDDLRRAREVKDTMDDHKWTGKLS